MSTVASPSSAGVGLRQALDDLARAAGVLERGQGDTPLGDELSRVQGMGPRDPLSIIILAPDVELRARALAWVLGLSEADREPLLAQPPALVPDLLVGPRQPGDALPPPGELANRIAAGGGESLVFSLPGAAETQLVCPETAGSASPVRVRRVTGSRLVVVAQRVRQDPADLQAAVEELTSAGMVLWRVAFQGAGDPPLRPPLPPAGAVALPSITVADDLTPAANLLSGPAALDVRKQIAALEQARAGLAASEMISDRRQAEERLLQARQRREGDSARPVDTAAPDEESRQGLDRLKGLVGEELARLSQDLRDSGRRAGLRNGEMYQLADELLGNLRGQDLAQEAAGKKIRLSLKPEVAEDLKTRFTEALKGQIEADAQRIQSAVARMDEAFDRAGAELGIAERLRIGPPDVVDEIWTPIEEALHLQVRYRGEMRRRGFLQRLGEGRRVIFLVLMVLSLIGGFLGLNVRRTTFLAPVFLLLFIGAVAWTFYSWRKEEDVNFDDELLRLRDVLSPELSRMLGDVLRERQARLQGVLEEVRRGALGGIDMLQRAAGASRLQRAEGERRSARTRLKVVEDRLREVQALAPSLQRATATLERAIGEARRELGSVGRAPAATPPPPAAG